MPSAIKNQELVTSSLQEAIGQLQDIVSGGRFKPEDRFQLYRGWLPLTIHLCEQVDRLLGPDKDAFHWVQFKEKLGSARFYGRWLRQPHDPTVKEAVAEAVNHAVLASARTRIVCGADAPVPEPDVPLCATHEALRPDRRWASAAECLDTSHTHP